MLRNHRRNTREVIPGARLGGIRKALIVIPAKAGIQVLSGFPEHGLRRGDGTAGLLAQVARGFLAWALVFAWLPCLPMAWGFVEFAGSPNPVGSGARALGMGGAFIAVADDATAASWNPGGLIQLERPEMSIVGSGLHRVEDNTLGRHPEGSGAQDAHAAKINFLSFTYPFRLWDHDMVVSLSYQHLFEFTRSWDWTLRDSTWQRRTTYQYHQDGGLYAWGVAYCAQLLPTLSLGLTVNIWEDGIYNNGWREEVSYTSQSRIGVRRGEISDEYAFSGVNANVGLFWSTKDRLSFGVVFKTPFTGDLIHDYDEVSFYGKTHDRTYEELDMPMSYGLGIAYQLLEQLTLSADVFRTHWQDFVLTDSRGAKVSGVNGLPPQEADIGATTQIRAGVEYLLVKPHFTIPLRAGLFYDPGPAQGSPDDYCGFSIGSGIGIGRFVFDFAYQYRFGRNVTSAIYEYMGFSQDVDDHTFSSSLIFYF